MIDPHAGCVLDSHAVVVKYTQESEVLHNDIRGIDDSHSVLGDRSILATNDGLIGPNDSQPSWEGELSFDDNRQWIRALANVSMLSWYL